MGSVGNRLEHRLDFKGGMVPAGFTPNPFDVGTMYKKLVMYIYGTFTGFYCFAGTESIIFHVLISTGYTAR